MVSNNGLSTQKLMMFRVKLWNYCTVTPCTAPRCWSAPFTPEICCPLGDPKKWGFHGEKDGDFTIFHQEKVGRFKKGIGIIWDNQADIDGLSMSKSSNMGTILLYTGKPDSHQPVKGDDILMTMWMWVKGGSERKNGYHFTLHILDCSIHFRYVKTQGKTNYFDEYPFEHVFVLL